MAPVTPDALSLWRARLEAELERLKAEGASGRRVFYLDLRGGDVVEGGAVTTDQERWVSAFSLTQPKP